LPGNQEFPEKGKKFRERAWKSGGGAEKRAEVHEKEEKG